MEPATRLDLSESGMNAGDPRTMKYPSTESCRLLLLASAMRIVTWPEFHTAAGRMMSWNVPLMFEATGISAPELDLMKMFTTPTEALFFHATLTVPPLAARKARPGLRSARSLFAMVKGRLNPLTPTGAPAELRHTTWML